MKTIIFVITAFLSVPAFADYFGCDLQVGNDQRASAEAEYRGRSVSVISNGWTCSGVIDNDLVVTATLTSPEADASSSASDRASASTELTLQDISSSCYCSLR